MSEDFVALAGETRCDRIAALAAWHLAGCPIFEGVAFPCGTVHTKSGVFPLVWFATQTDVDDALKLIDATTREAHESAPAA